MVSVAEIGSSDDGIQTVAHDRAAQYGQYQTVDTFLHAALKRADVAPARHRAVSSPPCLETRNTGYASADRDCSLFLIRRSWTSCEPCRSVCRVRKIRQSLINNTERRAKSHRTWTPPVGAPLCCPDRAACKFGEQTKFGERYTECNARKLKIQIGKWKKQALRNHAL